MALDTSIPLQVQPIKLASPNELAQNALALQAARMQMADAQRARAQEEALNQAYRQSMGKDGALDQNALYQNLAASGQGSKIPGLRKQFAETDKAINEADQQRFKAAKDRFDVLNSTIIGVLANPDFTDNDVVNAAGRLVSAGVMKPEQVLPMLQNLPWGNRDALKQILMQTALGAADASKKLDLMLPKTDIRDTGGALQSFQTNQLTGQVTPGGVVAQKTLPPEASIPQIVPLEGAGVFRVERQPGGRVEQVSGPSGPLVTQKPLTEVQGNATGFGMRASEANTILQALEKKGVTTPSLIKQGAENIPLIGGALGMAANATVASPDQQKVEQAQRDFINAILRKESGAAISPSEFENARKQYFAQPGDSQEVLRQKQANRQTAIEALRIQAGPGASNIPAQQPSQNRPGTPTDWQSINNQTRANQGMRDQQALMVLAGEFQNATDDASKGALMKEIDNLVARNPALAKQAQMYVSGRWKVNNGRPAPTPAKMPAPTSGTDYSKLWSQ